jgi:uncharacterized surface protein with fasciclin (FAS1) repeats
MKIKLVIATVCFLSLVGVAGVFLAGCNKQASPANNVGPTSTITAIIESASNATLFDSAMVKTGMDTIFSQTGPYTVFLPINNTFTAAGINAAVLDTFPDSVLRNLIEYTTIGAGILSTGFPVTNDFKIVATNGDSLFVTNIAGSLWVNGQAVVSGNVVASNGVIDVVSYPLFPATGNLLQTMQADTSLTLMVAALAACTPVINLDSLLSYGGIYSVFAPVNSAFAAAGYPSVAAINGANPDSLANIISYHVLPLRIFTCDWSSGQLLTTLNDSTLTAYIPAQGATGYYQVQGLLNATASNIIFGNLMAHNGVVHKIDQLFLP